MTTAIWSAIAKENARRREVIAGPKPLETIPQDGIRVVSDASGAIFTVRGEVGEHEAIATLRLNQNQF